MSNISAPTDVPATTYAELPTLAGKTGLIFSPDEVAMSDLDSFLQSSEGSIVIKNIFEDVSLAQKETMERDTLSQMEMNSEVALYIVSSDQSNVDLTAGSIRNSSVIDLTNVTSSFEAENAQSPERPVVCPEGPPDVPVDAMSVNALKTSNNSGYPENSSANPGNLSDSFNSEKPWEVVGPLENPGSQNNGGHFSSPSNSENTSGVEGQTAQEKMAGGGAGLVDSVDALVTLASAAIMSAKADVELESPDNSFTQASFGAASSCGTFALSTNGTEAEPKENLESPEFTLAKDLGKKKEEKWYNVGIIKGTSCVVDGYYVPDDVCLKAPKSKVGEDIKGIGEDDCYMGKPDPVHDPDHPGHTRVELIPGTIYKFRVAGINSCGKGPWSEVGAFKTKSHEITSFPGAPNAFKIFKNAKGALITWEPPQDAPGKIIQYSVYLAVRNSITLDKGANKSVISSNPAKLTFVRVHSGPLNQCTVPNSYLAAAHIDTTVRPAIIFRIAARNERGYGPATQTPLLEKRGTAKPVGHKTLYSASKKQADESSSVIK